MNNCFTKNLVLFLIVPLVALSSGCDFISNKILSKPLVQVASYELSAQDFSKQLAAKLKEFDALSAKDPQIISFFKEQIVSDFIISSFVNLWFDENALTLSVEEINAAVDASLATYPSSSVFKELLSEQGMSYSSWVESLKLQLKKKKLIFTLLEKEAKPGETELLSYYNNNRAHYEQKESVLLSHILVSDQNQAEIVKSLLRKQNFQDVAKRYSSAFSSETKDYYGWVERDFSPDLDKVFKMRVGETLGPILLSDGIHIFKLEEKRSFRLRPYAEVKKHVEREVLALREKSKFSAWLDVQIKKYRVKKNTSMLDSIQVETL